MFKNTTLLRAYVLCWAPVASSFQHINLILLRRFCPTSYIRTYIRTSIWNERAARMRSRERISVRKKVSTENENLQKYSIEKGGKKIRQYLQPSSGSVFFLYHEKDRYRLDYILVDKSCRGVQGANAVAASASSLLWAFTKDWIKFNSGESDSYCVHRKYG